MSVKIEELIALIPDTSGKDKESSAPLSGQGSSSGRPVFENRIYPGDNLASHPVSDPAHDTSIETVLSLYYSSHTKESLYVHHGSL